MTAADQPPLPRFERWWVLAGPAWGAVVGFGSSFAFLVLFTGLLSGVPSELDGSLVTAVLILGSLALSGAIGGGVAGLVVGAILMLAVGRDPEVRAARRTPALVTLLVGLPLLMAVLWLI